jgi:hypothetical protein
MDLKFTGCPIRRADKWNPINYAVVNEYVSPNYTASGSSGGPKLDAAGQFGPGACLQRTQAVWVMTGDTVLSIYRIFKNVPGDVIPVSLTILNDAWTNCTSINIGLYQVLEWDGVGAMIGSGNQLTAAYNPAAGNPITSAPVEILTAPIIANRNANLWMLAGQSEYPPKYAAFDIGLQTITNTGTATPNICIQMSYIRNN